MCRISDSQRTNIVVSFTSSPLNELGKYADSPGTSYAHVNRKCIQNAANKRRANLPQFVDRKLELKVFTGRGKGTQEHIDTGRIHGSHWNYRYVLKYRARVHESFWLVTISINRKHFYADTSDRRLFKFTQMKPNWEWIWKNLERVEIWYPNTFNLPNEHINSPQESRGSFLKRLNISGSKISQFLKFWSTVAVWAGVENWICQYTRK